MKSILITSLILLIGTSLSFSQQASDTTFIPKVDIPTYSQESGPVICIDSAHNNLHKMDGCFAPFAKLMAADGFRLKDRGELINKKGILSDCSIYAVINPLHESNLGNWRLPNPSAFTETEINEIESWVKEGG